MMTFEEYDKILAEKPGWKVYRYTFPNGKVYIGKTCRTMSQRQHTKDWEGYKNCPKVYAAIKKYGVENIVTNILFFGFMSEQECSIREREMIALYKSNKREYGYNLTEGGDGSLGVCISKESRKKISEVHKGKHTSEETRRKIREANKGKPSHNRKAVMCIETGTIYVSACDAAEAIGKRGCTVSDACKGRIHTAGGYHWKYVEEE